MDKRFTFQTPRFTRGGFTLIEMLIVVAIIGILAGAVIVGLGPAQKGGRDARRLSDLRQVQNALELYYNKNQKYPNSLSSNDWAGLSGALTGAAIGVNNVPKDPQSTQTYYYATDTNGTTYVLGTLLENPTGQAASSTYSGTTPSGLQAPAFPSNCGTAQANGTLLYCVTL